MNVVHSTIASSTKHFATSSIIIIISGLHHYECIAPLNQQPPEQAILNHINRFSECEIVGFKVI